MSTAHRSQLWNRIRSLIVLALLAGAVVYQARIILRGRVEAALEFWSHTKSMPAWQRAAAALEGDEFAEYIGFVRDVVPPTGSVMLPPHSFVGPHSHIGLMQYFLFPREIHNCGRNEVEACIERISEDPEFYVLAVRRFPPRELAEEGKDFVPFDEEDGVFVPGG